MKKLMLALAAIVCLSAPALAHGSGGHGGYRGYGGHGGYGSYRHSYDRYYDRYWRVYAPAAPSADTDDENDAALRSDTDAVQQGAAPDTAALEAKVAALKAVAERLRAQLDETRKDRGH
jgi:hypothetical protein